MGYPEPMEINSCLPLAPGSDESAAACSSKVNTEYLIGLLVICRWKLGQEVK